MIKYYLAKIIKKLKFNFVKNSKVHKSSKLESGTLFYESSMDENSFCGYNCEIINCEIGKYTSIANNVIIGGVKHPIDWVSTSPVFYHGKDSIKKKYSNFILEAPKKIIIKNDVWIGHSAIIISGVEIGDGAVIGAGSVVTKNVPPYSIVAGNPAKIIRYRFDDKTIEGLLKIKWWNLDKSKIHHLSDYIRNPKLFIENYKKYYEKL